MAININISCDRCKKDIHDTDEVITYHDACVDDIQQEAFDDGKEEGISEGREEMKEELATE